jgi:predicted CoA-binding protein
MSSAVDADKSVINQVLRDSRRIAVLGIKTERQADQPAFRIPRYLIEAGFEVVPVPVYYPEVTEILGKPVYRKLVDIPGEIDLVDVFRRPEDIPPHVDDMIAKRPRAVWFQLGIRNDEAAARLTAAGITVIQDRCLMVDHRRWVAAQREGRTPLPNPPPQGGRGPV